MCAGWAPLMAWVVWHTASLVKVSVSSFASPCHLLCELHSKRSSFLFIISVCNTQLILAAGPPPSLYERLRHLVYTSPYIDPDYVLTKLPPGEWFTSFVCGLVSLLVSWNPSFMNVLTNLPPGK